jgi:hypothetical protein
VSTNKADSGGGGDVSGSVPDNVNPDTVKVSGASPLAVSAALLMLMALAFI